MLPRSLGAEPADLGEPFQWLSLGPRPRRIENHYETVLWPAGTFTRAYAANRRAAIESVIDADPVASRVRDIMADRHIWIGTAADLLNYGSRRQGDYDWHNRNGWPRSPRALAGRLRRAQPGLRSLGIDIVFRPRRPSRNQNDQHEAECRTHRPLRRSVSSLMT
jgi:hypothetical protein